MPRPLCVQFPGAICQLMSRGNRRNLSIALSIVRTDPFVTPLRQQRQARKLANRFKDSKDPFKIVIVREGEAPRPLWLTRFVSTRRVCTRWLPTSRCKATGECRMTNSE